MGWSRGFILGGLAAVGLVAVWRWMDGPARLGAAALYLTGWVCYVELLSLLSRGYSLRILVDLLGRNGQATLEELKASYGNGMGLHGMLSRRVTTLSRLGLIHCDGDVVGPLTWTGRLAAAVTDGMRRLLKLECSG